ncbi:MAG: hypothetical protein U0271_31785 [Polyangiaceae bacterium]
MRVSSVTPTTTARAAGIEQKKLDKPSAASASGRVVEGKKTVLSSSDIRRALAEAYVDTHGEPMSKKMLDVLTAQACHETAAGASMYNYNFGGIKGTSPEGATTRLLTHEVFDGREVTIRDGFRAYSSARAGAADYLNLLERRFPRAMDAAARGDVDDFVARLKAGHYFTGEQGAYAASLRALVAQGFDTASAGQPLEMREEVREGEASPTELVLPTQADLGPTSVAVARVLDALTVSSLRIAAPDPSAGV